ncbi:MAG: FlgD immunoglobulin-like domain containing protein [candidate division WOR-3 bacterium]
MRAAITSLACLGALAVLQAQTYRCDWSVVGAGGGEMSSSAYRCGATAGQTAVGTMTGTGFQAFIGFWQIDAPVGIQEEVERPGAGVLATRLCSPMPNPARAQVAIRYSLAADGPVSLAVHDITGRVVRQLLATSVRRGAYSVVWNGTDNRGRKLADGVYFAKFTAGEYHRTEKLVVQR